MVVLKVKSKYFESIESGRGPPMRTKRTASLNFIENVFIYILREGEKKMGPEIKKAFRHISPPVLRTFLRGPPSSWKSFFFVVFSLFFKIFQQNLILLHQIPTLKITLFFRLARQLYAVQTVWPQVRE
jgi:hypothetical protein